MLFQADCTNFAILPVSSEQGLLEPLSVDYSGLYFLHQPIVHGSLGGLNAAAVGLLVPTMFVVYDTLQAACCWQGRIVPEKTHWFDQVE